MKVIKYVFCAVLFVGASAVAETININWINDGANYAQSACTVGGDITLPTPPTKRGYTFVGWEATNYQQVEYIETDGKSYIDTGITLGSGTNIIDYSIKYTSGTATNEYIFGATTGGNSESVSGSAGSVQRNTTVLRPGCGNNNLRIDNRNYNYNSGIDIELYMNVNITTQQCGVKINADEQLYFSYSGTNVIDQNIYLFAINRNGTAAYASSSAKIYYFRIKKDGILVGDFQPVKRMSDGVYGFYDKVTNTFFANMGVGVFTGGPVIESPYLE